MKNKNKFKITFSADTFTIQLLDYPREKVYILNAELPITKSPEDILNYLVNWLDKKEEEVF
jgi:hypothetical protein